jgi:hypothetical protein
MYAETSTLVWEVNTFEFDGAWLGVQSIHPANTPRSFTGIMQAYSFFIRHAGHNVIHAIRSVLFRFDLFGTVAQIMRFIQSSADHLPRAHLTAVIENWYILRLHGVSTTSAMHCFVGVAREMLKYGDQSWVERLQAELEDPLTPVQVGLPTYSGQGAGVCHYGTGAGVD